MSSLAANPSHARHIVDRRGWPVLLVMALVVFCYRLFWVWSHGFSLFVDEAQYWQWSTEPAFGYYSKPPLVAWLIAATTGLFGEGELAIRLPALLAWPLTGIGVGVLAGRWAGSRAAVISAAIFLSMPGQMLSGWIVSPDAFLLLAWVGALLALDDALRGTALRPWLLLGLALGVGTLAKYSMLMFLPGLLWLLGQAGHRHHWRHAGPWLAMAVLLIVISPNLYWNLQSGFETVRHTAEIAGTSAKGWWHPRHLLEFLAAQWLIFGLLAFPLMLCLLRARSDFAGFLRPFIVPYLLLMCLLALFSHANANWAAVVYVAGSVLVGIWLARPERRYLAWATLSLSLLLGLAVMHYRDIAPVLGVALPKRDLHSRVEGWRELGQSMQPIFDREGRPVLLAADRHVLSQFGYYLKPAPYPVRAFSADGRIAHHYDLLASQQPLPVRAIWVADADAGIPDQLAAIYRERRDLGVVSDPHGLRRMRLLYLSDPVGAAP